MEIWQIILAVLTGAALLYRLYDLYAIEQTVRRVPKPGAQPAGELPSLSVIVPARNEERKVERALETLRAQDYPGLEIILVDDRSDDATGEIMQRAAEGDARVRTVKVEQLQRNWLGKVNAQRAGVRRANGEWVLFTDADVHFAEGALRRMVGHAVDHGLDHMAAFIEMSSRSPLIDAVTSVFMLRFFVRTRCWEVRDPDSEAAVGVGAFNLVRREALEESSGLEWIRLEVAEDVALAEMLKQEGFSTGVVNAAGLVSVDWYTNWASLSRGMMRIALIGAFFRPWVAIAGGAGFGLLELAPLAGLFLLPAPYALGLALPAAAAAFYAHLRATLWSRKQVLAGLLWPLGSLVLSGLAVAGGVRSLREGGLRWRETFYSLRDLQRGRRLWTGRGGRQKESEAR